MLRIKPQPIIVTARVFGFYLLHKELADFFYSSDSFVDYIISVVTLQCCCYVQANQGS